MKQLSVHITDACNSKCSFCVVGSPLARHDSVNYADIIKFLAENADQGYDSVNLHGGEPTIHPLLFPLLETITMLGYPDIQIQTNGRKLKDLAFAESLAAHGVRLVVISLHGAIARTQDALAQASGSFEDAIAGIRNAKRVGLRIRTNTVVTIQNLDELDSLAYLLRELDVDHANISNLHPVGSGFFAFKTLIPLMTETRVKLIPAIERLLSLGLTVTLEGFPFCVITPYEELAIEYHTRKIRMLYQQQIYDDYDDFMKVICRVQGPPCLKCKYKAMCGGVYKEYIDHHGWSEFASVSE